MRFRIFLHISNGLNTARRFQSTPQPCAFCNAANQDHLEHYSICTTLQHIAHPLLLHITKPYTKYQFFLADELPTTMAGSMCILHDILHSTLRALHHGHGCPYGLARARAHQLLRRQPAFHAFFFPA